MLRSNKDLHSQVDEAEDSVALELSLSYLPGSAPAMTVKTIPSNKFIFIFDCKRA